MLLHPAYRFISFYCLLNTIGRQKHITGLDHMSYMLYNNRKIAYYINDARFFYTWITHTIKFIIYLFMTATFLFKEE